MKIHFYSPNRIEPWSYKNVYQIGIGGSETSHVEMAVRLAARGHEVTSYTDLPEGEAGEWNKVQWRDLSEADLTEPGLWIVYRSPHTGREIKPAYNRRYWLVCQDVFYPTWNSKDVQNFDRVIGLCPRHVNEIRAKDKANASKVCMSSNGVNIDGTKLMKERGIERNPKRLIWASSPDRGLKELLDIFERAKQQIDDLELHCFYGMDNIDKICSGDRKKYPWKISWDVYERAQNMPGVTWQGRVGQYKLWEEYLKSGIWCYPTWFSETSCISCMEAQVLGAIPITNPIWATAHNVKHGVFIEGSPAEPLITCRYVDAIVRLIINPESAEALRKNMMVHAESLFSWENWVTQWEEWMEESCYSEEKRSALSHTWEGFQQYWKHLHGHGRKWFNTMKKSLQPQQTTSITTEPSSQITVPPETISSPSSLGTG